MLTLMRHLAWYRLIPLALVALVGIAAAVFSYAPAPLFKARYPLEYESYIEQSSDAHSVDPFLVAAVIKTESNWSPTERSHKDAAGLMQLMPETAQDMLDMGFVDKKTCSVSNLDDPATNIEFGCAYLSYLIKYFHGSTDRAIAAYNAGMGKVNDWVQEDTALHNAITYPETQAYLIQVNNAHARYLDLYPDRFKQ